MPGAGDVSPVHHSLDYCLQPCTLRYTDYEQMGVSHTRKDVAVSQTIARWVEWAPCAE